VTENVEKRNTFVCSVSAIAPIALKLYNTRSMGVQNAAILTLNIQ